MRRGSTQDAVQASAVQATNVGVARMEGYEFAKAVEAFEEAVKLAPRSVETRTNLAIALFNRASSGDLEKAEQLLDAVVEQQGDHASALYMRGVISQYRGDDAEAATFFDRVVRLRPGDAYAWYLLARSKSHLGQPCKAELERAIKANPAFASAYYDLFRLAALDGRTEEAQALQEQFVRLRESPLAETVVMPNYRQIGPLAVVQPLSLSCGAAARAAPVAGGELRAAAVRVLAGELAVGGADRVADLDRFVGRRDGMAAADVDGDGHADLLFLVPRDDEIGVLLLVATADAGFVDRTGPSGLAGIRGARSLAFGDYDNDGAVDLYVNRDGPNALLRGRGDGTFVDAATAAGAAGPDARTTSALFLDADHDGDLDLLVCGASGSSSGTSGGSGGTSGSSVATAGGAGEASRGSLLLNNNADGTFTDITSSAGIACSAAAAVAAVPADLDHDRDTDLAVFQGNRPVRFWMNDRGGKYHETAVAGVGEPTGWGGIAQDFSGDGRADLLTLRSSGEPGELWLSRPDGLVARSESFDDCLKTVRTWGDVRQSRVADIDLDGDLDVVLLGAAGHVLLNDGSGAFVSVPNVWPSIWTDRTIAADLIELTGDGVADVVRLVGDGGGRLELIPTELQPLPTWLAVTPTGERGDDQRTRSPTTAFGTKLETQRGGCRQVIVYDGLGGGLCQSCLSLTIGLDGAKSPDYILLTWPDGVTQSETGLTASAYHRIRETQRRIASCPVLFAWNGERFAFVGDFAGVGGLGYYVAPNTYAEPRAREHVGIGPDQLRARDGAYEVRITEPMEEVAYVDRLELLAVDHPGRVEVYPDERLVLSGSPASQKLLCVERKAFPATALSDLLAVDRQYAYAPPLDRRFIGFCRPHELVLDFSVPAAWLSAPADLYLFLSASIEYPYSQTVYAAAQAGTLWQPLAVEYQTDDGDWRTLVPDAGAPGGISRTIAVSLADLPAALNESGGEGPARQAGDGAAGRAWDGAAKRAGGGATRQVGNDFVPVRLRVTTNMEIYYDQAFVAVDRGLEGLAVRSVPLRDAALRRLGFAKEYSPDGRYPTVYDYDVIEATSSFKTPSGDYTRYGPVEELLGAFDDRYVILGPGDELAVRFDAAAVPPILDGWRRSFVLVSHAYCKDMDLYTGAPDEVGPLPFRAMRAYPYAPDEQGPADEAVSAYRRDYNTRKVR